MLLVISKICKPTTATSSQVLFVSPVLSVFNCFWRWLAQEEVFDEISQLVQSALDGYKVCIFAYGQTGSGKTHTMLGTAEERGMIPRAMDQIFASSAAMEAQGWSFDMRVGCASCRSSHTLTCCLVILDS